MSLKNTKILNNIPIPPSLQVEYGYYSNLISKMKIGGAAVVDSLGEAKCLVRAGHRKGWKLRTAFQKDGPHKGKHLVFKMRKLDEPKKRSAPKKKKKSVSKTP